MSSFCDLCTFLPEEKSSARELIRQAEEAGIGVLGVIRKAEELGTPGELVSEVQELEGAEFPKLVPGVLIEPESKKELSDRVSEFRESITTVIVRGGDSEINRAAAEDSRVDVLLEPELGRRDPGIDHVVSRKLEKNRVSVGVNFRRIVKASGRKRAQLLSKLSRLFFFSEKFSFDIVLVSAAEDKYGVRAPRDMASLGEVLGAEAEEAEKWVSENPLKSVKRFERASSESSVMPGVEVVDDES